MPQNHLYIITGASRGMGLAMARQLLAPGNVVLTLSRRVNGDLAPLAASAGAALTQWSTDLTDGTAAATGKVKDCKVGYIELKVQGASNVGASQDAATKMNSAAHMHTKDSSLLDSSVSPNSSTACSSTRVGARYCRKPRVV